MWDGGEKGDMKAEGKWKGGDTKERKVGGGREGRRGEKSQNESMNVTIFLT